MISCPILLIRVVFMFNILTRVILNNDIANNSSSMTGSSIFINGYGHLCRYCCVSYYHFATQESCGVLAIAMTWVHGVL